MPWRLKRPTLPFLNSPLAVKTWMVALAVFSLLVATRAGAGMEVQALPERCAVPIARLKGQRLTIVDFRSEVPRVILDGREVPAEPGVSLVPGDALAPGFIKVAEASVSTDIYENYLRVGDNGKPLDTRYQATLTADRDLQKVFLLFLLFEDNEGDFSDVPRLTITDYAVGKLAAGKQKGVDFRFAPLVKRDSTKRMVWTVLAFSGGAQIKTSYGNGVLNAFFDSLDRVQRQKMIAQRSTGTFPPRACPAVSPVIRGRAQEATRRPHDQDQRGHLGRRGAGRRPR
jgi:hypothetical protein